VLYIMVEREAVDTLATQDFKEDMGTARSPRHIVRRIGWACIILGLMCNQWILSILFPPQDGTLAFESKVLIGIFQFFIISVGLFLCLRSPGSIRFKHLLLGFLFCFFAIGSVEIVLRVYFHIFEHNLVRKQLRNLTPFKDKEWADTFLDERFAKVEPRFDPFILFRSAAYDGTYINIDTHGRRKTWNAELVDGQDEKAIYFFGGSTIRGMYSRDNFTIPSRFSKMLYEEVEGYTVSNYGTDGYTFTQEVVRLTMLLRDGHRPQHVIFYDGVNDTNAALKEGKWGAVYGEDEMRRRFEGNHFFITLKENFKIVELVATRIPMLAKRITGLAARTGLISQRYAEDHTTIIVDAVAREYAKTYGLLQGLSRIYGFTFQCFWQPVAYVEDDLLKDELSFDTSIQNSKIVNFFRQTYARIDAASLPNFYNIQDALRGRSELAYIDHCHLSEYGSQRVALRIYDLFRQKFLIASVSARP